MAENGLNNEEIRRYSRHLSMDGFGIEEQNKLKSAQVLIIGCGGLGCPLALYLAAAGVGTIGLVDHDKVELSNLQRQVLFGTQDIGKYKVAVAADKLLQLNNHVNVNQYPVKIMKSNALEIAEDYDIIVDGTDNFPTRYLINDLCVILGKLNVHGSISQFEGQVSVFNGLLEDGTRGVNYRDLFPSPPSVNSVPNCAEAGVLGVLPGIIGSMQASEVIKLITGIGSPLINKLFIFDAASMKSRVIALKKNPSTIIEELIDYDHFCGVSTNKQKDSMVKEISVSELNTWRTENKDFQLIDVREQHEFDFCNLGGVLIPLGGIMDKAEEISKDKPVVVHCRSGARSANAIMALQQLHGHENLYNLKGGIIAWSKEIDPSVPQY